MIFCQSLTVRHQITIQSNIIDDDLHGHQYITPKTNLIFWGIFFIYCSIFMLYLHRRNQKLTFITAWDMMLTAELRIDSNW